MLVNHERRLLKKAAEAVDLQISIRQNTDRSWPSDHSRLVALETRGDFRRVIIDTSGACAVWRLTDSGLATLQQLNASPA